MGVWELVIDDGVLFVCAKHHVEMSEAKIIRLERMISKETWNKFDERTGIFTVK
jgi:hypothetical protein